METWKHFVQYLLTVMERADLQRRSEQHEGLKYGAAVNIMDMEERGIAGLLVSCLGTWTIYLPLGGLGTVEVRVVREAVRCSILIYPGSV